MASSSIACVQFSVKKSLVIPSTIVGTKSPVTHKNKKQRSLKVVAAIGDVSSDGTVYLIAGAAAVALVGTAFPILFSRKDLSVLTSFFPFCDLSMQSYM